MNATRNAALSVLLATTFALSQEGSSSEKSSALYFHPVATGILAAAGVPTLYLTYEKELGSGRSWTLQPLFGSGTFKDSDKLETDVTQFGAITSYRFYHNGAESRGWYAAPAVGLCYMDLKRESYDVGWFTIPEQSGSATQFGAMGMLGYRSRKQSFTWFWDIGLGFQALSTTGDVEAQQSTGVLVDMNLGLGFRL